MELQQLRYFAKAAELGNFTRAAEACLVSQPSLSQQIIKLEQELGQPLFERLGRQVRLTEAGKLLKERVDQVLTLLDDAQARISDHPDEGRLVIAAIPSIAPYYLPGVLEGFRRTCPGAQLEVVEDVTQNSLRKLAEGEIDLAILALPVHGTHLHAESLFTEELLVVLPTGHPLAEKPRLALKDLSEEPFVLLNDSHCLTQSTLSFCQQKKFQPIVTSRISQLATLQELVTLGQGISLIPEMARRLDTSPTRVYRSLAGTKPTRTIALVWHQYRFQTQLFKRFVDWLKKHPQPGVPL
ncbi:MAG TPA: LysR family transcriptional regulator [Pirellulaceae bacterium]|nr:LysR family transcriptional regulator [Pirellulaceae bacterium]